MSGAEHDTSVREFARLEALRRLAMGGAHSLNNAFTAAIGEASFLLEDHKDADPELLESCQMILASLDRCARITRALLARNTASRSGDDTDLGRMIRELCPLLQETLGSRYSLTAALPNDLVLAPGPPADLELLLLTWIQYAANYSGPDAALEIRLEEESEDSGVVLHLHIRAPSLPANGVDTFLDSSAAPDPVARVCFEALETIAAEIGARKHATQTTPTTWTTSFRLPRTA